MDKICLNVGIGMLAAPIALVAIICLISSLISFGISSVVMVCIAMYVATALFLIIRGCVTNKK